MEVCNGILGAANQKRLPTDFELITICRKEEYIMNTWRLGKFIGYQDDAKSLRPIDLLTGYLNPRDDDLLFSETTTAKDKLRRGHQYTHRHSQEWWQKWTNGFMHSLQQRSNRHSDERNFKRSSFVLLDGPATPPMRRCPNAAIESRKYCPDERVRSAAVRLSYVCIREKETFTN